MKFDELYISTEDYIDILLSSVKEAYKHEGPWHPEDIGSNVAAANDVLLRGLTEYTRLIFNRSKNSTT